MLYLPVALRGIRSFGSCFEWITTTFAPFNVKHIEMWTDLTVHQAHQLQQFNGIYIGGGNTYALFAELIASGFNNHLREYVDEGGMIYGGSAGAVILGKDIRTVSHMDRNETGLIEINCLNLANDHAVWPHYRSQDDQLIENFVRTFQLPVLAIPERSGIVIESGRMQTVGFEPSYCFNNHGKSEV